MSASKLPSSRTRACARPQGFTLPEMLITVAIAGILAAVAAPSFSDLVGNQRVKNAASELYSSLSRTRSEAITRGVDITLAPKTGGWGNGWQITDPNSQASGKVLDDKGAFTGLVITGGPASVVYRGSGRLQTGNAPMFVVKPGSGGGSASQCVSVEPNGRPYMKAGTSC